MSKQEDLSQQHSQLSSAKQGFLESLIWEESQASVETPVIPRRSERDTAPLSFAQRQLWFLAQLDPSILAYNVPLAYRLTGQLNVVALEQSLGEIMRRHEALRTTFADVDGQPVQVIAPKLGLTLPVVDLQEVPPEQREIEAQRLANEEAQQPFNLEQGPLLRGQLLRLSTEEHVLLLTMHHIISDGWSLGVFMRELAALYEAFSNGNPSPLPELPIQYADFAVCQRQWLTNEVLETQLSYWQQQLTEAPPLLELPTDRPRPPVKTFRGSTKHFQLNPNQTKRLNTLSQRSGATLFMVLLAAFTILLSRYSGQEDIVVGSPIANRKRSETEFLIGFFVNTLVLRTDLSGNPTFQELLGRVRQVALDAYAHQDMPFEQLVEALQPERNLSHTPLFHVMFVLQNARMGKLELPGLTITPLEIKSVMAKFDLTLSMEETESGLRGTLEYNTDLFDAATITRMAGHFQTLLEEIVANPQQRLSELPLLMAAERYQLLVEWNNTQADYPKDTCIHRLFEAQVQRTPDAVAVVFEDQQLTYRELNCRANQLAHYLLKLGVEPEVLVGICMERSLEMVVGLLGIFKAGGAYVPLDPEYPKERLAFMLEDTQVPVLLTQKQLIGEIPKSKAYMVCVDASWKTFAQESSETPVSGVTDENLAWVTYTSGSTGKPKGVMICHRDGCMRLLWLQATYQLTEVDRFLLKNASLREFLPAFLVGGRVIVAQPGRHRDIAYLIKLIAEQKITVIHVVPSMLELLLEGEGLEACNCLRHVFSTGESLPVRLQDRFFVRLAAELHNLYGQTEASCATVWKCLHGNNQLTVPIGHPTYMQVYLLDSNLQPVPIGVVGELHIGGVGLARGYLNRPELTAEKFIPNPFSDNKPGARLYKTGDQARYLSDGKIELLGRSDHRVKIRGLRIEPGEIETVLAQHPAVRETVVIAREDVPGDKRLVAYVVPNQEHPATSGDLRRFLKEKLPEYMVPSAFVLLEALPLTPNGKVDRKTLPPPDPSRRGLETGFVAPRNALEMQLAQIWEDVLDVHPVGVRDNFFDLGGHSLLAIRLMAQIQQQFRENLPLATLFQSPTIEHLASVLRQQSGYLPWSPLGGTLRLLINFAKRLFDLTGNRYQQQTYQNKLQSKGLLPKFPQAGRLVSTPTTLLLKLPYYRNILRCFSNSTSSLVEIQPGVSKRPFFCVPGVVGTVFYLYHLARHLGSDQPFYGLQALGLDGESEPYSRVEDIAAYYIKLVQAVQPQGPYLLGGHSFGGLVAFAMAQQLQEQGHEVALLAIIDTMAPVLGNKPAGGDWDDAKSLTFLVSLVERWTGKKLEVSHDTLQSLDPAKQLNYLKECLKMVNPLLPTIGIKRVLAILQVLKASLNANYVPQEIYPNRITVFRSSDSSELYREHTTSDQLSESLRDPTLGWGQLSAEPVELHVIPGDHVTLMAEPHVQVLAERLRACLDQIQAADFKK